MAAPSWLRPHLDRRVALMLALRDSSGLPLLRVPLGAPLAEVA